jgi:NAD(P)-dependent dehydrogenase (short-subunit alcohol dehydrogenase family)
MLGSIRSILDVNIGSMAGEICGSAAEERPRQRTKAGVHHLTKSFVPAWAPRGVRVYAPGEDLERIDVALIDEAMKQIDMAAYVLTDSAVIEALRAAARR